MIRTRTARRGAVVLAAVSLAAATGCTPAGGGQTTQPPPTTASVTFTTSFSSSGAPKCTVGSVQWSATPVSVPQGQGNASAVTASEAGHDIQPSGGRCGLNHRFTDLRPGRWRLGVVAGLASGTCEADLPAGLTFVGLEAGACSVR